MLSWAEYEKSYITSGPVFSYISLNKFACLFSSDFFALKNQHLKKSGILSVLYETYCLIQNCL